MRFAPDRQIGGGIIRTEPATWAKYVAALVDRQHRVHGLSAIRCIPRMVNLLTNVQADKLAKLFPDRCRQRKPSLMNVALVGQRIDRVRSLTGFRSTHRVPDEVNEFTEAFVAKIASEQIDQDLEKMFAAMRNHFRFKRTEINVTDGDACGEATIATPHFEYTVAVSLNPANPAQVVWRRQLSEIHDLSQILSHASTEVFGPMFDTVELSPPHPVDLEALIDRIEAIEGEQIKVDYDKQTTWCKVEIAGILGELQVSARSISLVQQTVKSPGILLQSFLDFQTALIETYGVGAMTFNGSANARID